MKNPVEIQVHSQFRPVEMLAVMKFHCEQLRNCVNGVVRRCGDRRPQRKTNARWLANTARRKDELIRLQYPGLLLSCANGWAAKRTVEDMTISLTDSEPFLAYSASNLWLSVIFC